MVTHVSRPLDDYRHPYRRDQIPAPRPPGAHRRTDQPVDAAEPYLLAAPVPDPVRHTPPEVAYRLMPLDQADVDRIPTDVIRAITDLDEDPALPPRVRTAVTQLGHAARALMRAIDEDV